MSRFIQIIEDQKLMGSPTNLNTPVQSGTIKFKNKPSSMTVFDQHLSSPSPKDSLPGGSSKRLYKVEEIRVEN